MTIANGYCTYQEVIDFFQAAPVNRVFDQTKIEALIDRFGLEVERITKHSWREVSVSNEYHTVSPNVNNGPYYNIYMCHLKHFEIRSITKLELFDGSSWIDYIATKTEGRGADYWYDASIGIIYINGYRWIWHGYDCRVTYKYGGASVPTDVWELNLRYVARHILSMPGFHIVVPESKSGSKKDAIDRNEDRIRELEAGLANTMTPAVYEGDWI